MKTIIGLLALFVAASRINGEENSTVSNGTIPSKVNNESPDILKNIVALFHKIAKKKSSTTIEANTTVSSIELSRSNLTRDNSINTTLSPTTENHEANINVTHREGDLNVATRENDLNTTEMENNLALNYTEDITNAPTIKKNDASLTDNDTQYLENNTIPEGNLADDVNITDDDTVLKSLNNEDKDIYTSTISNNVETIARDENSTISNNVETVATECNTKRETYSDTSIVPELSTLNPEDHENYCKPYIDKLLTATFSEHRENLDPLLLENRKMYIETNFLIGSGKSELGLYDGRVTGISKAKIIGECNVQRWGNQMMLKSTLSFDVIGVSYRGKAAILNLGPEITVNGRLVGSLAELFIAVPKHGGVGEVKDVRVKNIGKLEVDVKGLGPLNRALKLISEGVGNVFRLDFRRTIEGELRDAIEEEIEKVNYP